MLNSTLFAARQRISRSVKFNGGILRQNVVATADAVDVLHVLDEEGFITISALETSRTDSDKFLVAYDVNAVLA